MECRTGRRAAGWRAGWLLPALAVLLVAACGESERPAPVPASTSQEAPAPASAATRPASGEPFEPPPDWCGTGRTWPVPEPRGGWRIRLRPDPPAPAPAPPAEPASAAGDEAEEPETYIPPPNWCGTPGMGRDPPPVPAWETFHLEHADGRTLDFVSRTGDQDPDLRRLLRAGWRVVGRTQGVTLRPQGR